MNTIYVRRTHLSLIICMSFIAILSDSVALASTNIQQSGQYQKASMDFDGQTLTIGTGEVTRQWRLTQRGLSTIGLHHAPADNVELDPEADNLACDWDLGGLGHARLVSLTAQEHNDEQFTNSHLRVLAEFEYPEDQLALRYDVWAYPGAAGLRTQLSVRRLGAEHASANLIDDGPTIRVVRGKAYIAPGSADLVDHALASNLHHQQAVQFHIVGLDPDKTYILGLSWWDWGGGQREQMVRVTSVDGETDETLIPPSRLPAWKGEKQKPAELSADVPDSVLMDGTFRVFVDRIAGPNANVSEVWLYATGDTDAGPVGEQTKRTAELKAKAPAGHYLAAYMDCGGGAIENSEKEFSPQVVDSFVYENLDVKRHVFGLVQGIKTNMTAKILKEQELSISDSVNNWGNGVIFHDEEGGMILVKESHKHTAMRKEDDLATGGFVFNDNHVSVTGAGLLPSDLTTDAYKTCWATWVVLYQGDRWDGNLALKRFDRTRYPINPDRDIYILANTWGTEDLRPGCLHAAREENVLRELESVADLGIDVLQIDDGWQTPEWTTAARSTQVQRGSEAVKVFGDYPVYPEGWGNVCEKADKLGVTLGLWAAWTAPLDALEANYDLGKFKYFKLDFAHLDSKSKYDELKNKARELIIHSGHKARVNWDVTEIAPRMGYFSGREYGNIYVANRKTKTIRKPVLYVPYKVLNDAWNLSKYVNLNAFQITVQNVDSLPLEPGDTDAAMHGHEYVVGISLMSSPIFFQETRYYKPTARKEIRHVLSVYKEHREAMYRGYVFPIGDEPDNGSWTGFQNHDPDTGNGYLTLFRERQNQSTHGGFNLKFIRASELSVTNLLTGQSSGVSVGPEGRVEFEIPEAPGFLFMRYETQ